jgi:uncharacterized membrane protein YphA (DoxX/SURF4 family)
MRIVLVTLQIAASLGLLNVWLLRFNRRTAYRGGDATSMQEEFASYGLPAKFAYVVGALKVGSALALIAGIWLPAIVFPAAALICVLMLGAVGMHARIHDPLTKSIPALGMLVLCLCICWIAIT